MKYDGIDMAYSKYAMWAVYGPKVAPELAMEVIRRTDGSFMSYRGTSPYLRTVKRLMGVPLYDDRLVRLPGGKFEIDMNQLLRDLDTYKVKWGFLDYEHLNHLTNSIVACGMGWCYPDGTIALYDEIKWGYPSAIWDECEAIATAFPGLDFSVCYWGGDGPAPSAGYVVRDGRVTGTAGDSPELFGRFGDLDYRSVKAVIEEATTAAQEQLPVESKFADRMFDQFHGWEGPVRGLPDETIENWIVRARSLNLTAH